MRNLVLIIWFFFSTSILIAQDTLYKENGSKLLVTVLDQNEFQVKYKKLIDPDSLIYVIYKDEIKKIVFKDGSLYFFPKNDRYENQSEIRFDSHYKRPRDKFIPKKFSKKYYYVNIIEANFILSKAFYEDGFLAKGKYKFSMGFHEINGMQFCKNHFIGLGFGFNSSMISDYAKGTLTGMPFFVDYRYYILKLKPKIYGNVAIGVFKSGNIFHFHDAFYLPFINPSIGIRFKVNQRLSGNLSLGYTLYIHKATLFTTAYLYYNNYYYNHDPYFYSVHFFPYQEHLVWNNKNSLNLKFAFVF